MPDEAPRIIHTQRPWLQQPLRLFQRIKLSDHDIDISQASHDALMWCKASVAGG